MNTELQNQENDVQRKVLEEILVEEMSGFVAYYDPETKEVEQADSLTCRFFTRRKTNNRFSWKRGSISIW